LNSKVLQRRENRDAYDHERGGVERGVWYFKLIGAMDESYCRE